MDEYPPAVSVLPTLTPAEQERGVRDVEERFRILIGKSEKAVAVGHSRIGIHRRLAFLYSRSDKQNPLLVRYLQQQANSPDELISLNALMALGTLQEKEPDVFNRLVTALMEHPDGDVRMCAAAALGEFGDPRAVPYLERALSDLYRKRMGKHIVMRAVAESAQSALARIRNRDFAINR